MRINDGGAKHLALARATEGSWGSLGEQAVFGWMLHYMIIAFLPPAWRSFLSPLVFLSMVL